MIISKLFLFYLQAGQMTIYFINLMPAFSYCRWGVIWKQWYDTNFIGNGTYQVSIRLSLDIVG